MKLAEQVRSTHNQDGAVVLDILHGEVYRLNLVGSRMLELLKNGLTKEQIADTVSREFDTAHETVAADLEEFLVHLENHQLLDLVELRGRSIL